MNIESNKLQELQMNVIEWAEERGIFDKATAIRQAFKTLEECGELISAVAEHEQDKRYNDYIHVDTDVTKEDVKDAIGDIIVTLIIQATMQGTTIQECLEQAYNEIKDRTGNMVNGTFVKDK